MGDDYIKEGLRAAACFVASVDDVIDPGACQADLAHLFDFYLRTYAKGDQVACCPSSGEAEVKCYFSSYEDVMSCRNEPAAGALDFEPNVDFVMTCPGPEWYSTGAHRTMFSIWYEGEHYAVAVEEGEGFYEEPVFIAGETPEAMRRLDDTSYAIDIVEAAVMAVARVEVYPPVHRFDVHKVEDYSALVMQGCQPSPYFYKD
jgi:hypothetical protein